MPEIGLGMTNFQIRKAIGILSKAIFPSYGQCKRCGLTWNICKEHSTEYSDYEACFPLCEDCWEELETPKNRIPYYKKLIDKWKEGSYNGENDEKIINAVNEGK